jgi:hypothetical protein
MTLSQVKQMDGLHGSATQVRKHLKKPIMAI